MMRNFLSGLAIGISMTAAALSFALTTPRSSTQKRRFEKLNPITSEPKCVNPDGTVRMRKIRDCVVDHIVPLVCGGPDHPDNMQWQTYTESMRKDDTERTCPK